MVSVPAHGGVVVVSLRIGLAGLVVVCWLLCRRVDNGWQIVTRFAAVAR